MYLYNVLITSTNKTNLSVMKKLQQFNLNIKHPDRADFIVERKKSNSNISHGNSLIREKVSQ